MADKLERLLNLLAALLATRTALTADELQRRIPGYPESKSAFRRAFERDKEDLREMGVPITIEPSPGTTPPTDGYRVDPAEYYIADPGLEPDELAALHLASSLFGIDGTNPTEALWNLGGTIADETPSRLAALPTDPNLGAILGAIRDRAPTTFRYNDQERTVEPWRLDFRKGHWYLTGFDHARGAERNFRLDRIDGRVSLGSSDSFTAEVVSEARPFGPWRFGDEEPLSAKVLVDADQAASAVRQIEGDGEVQWHDDGSVTLTLTVRRPEALRSFVLSFLEHAEILGPAALRDDMIAWLRSLADTERSGEPTPEQPTKTVR